MSTLHEDKPLGDARALGALIANLAQTVDDRVDGDAAASYTAKLLSEGPLACGKKVAEEGAELALALAAQGQTETASEAADLIYHILVGLRSKGVSLDSVADALAARQGRAEANRCAVHKDKFSRNFYRSALFQQSPHFKCFLATILAGFHAISDCSYPVIMHGAVDDSGPDIQHLNKVFGLGFKAPFFIRGVACVEIISQSLDSWPQSNDSLKQSLLSTGSDSFDGVSDSHSVKRLSLTGNAAINNLIHDENHVSNEQSNYGANRDEEKTVDSTYYTDDSHENSSSIVTDSSADVLAAYVTNSEIAQEITDKNAEKAAAYENQAIIDASMEICNMVDNDLYNSSSNKP